MVLSRNSIFKNFVEILLITFPISLLFSNVIAEFYLILIILFYLIDVEFENLIKDLKRPLIFYLLIFWLYLIINSIINVENKPSFERAIFFIRFPLLILSLNHLINKLDINLKKLFSSWIIIFFIISIDLFIQFLTLKNILGYEAVKYDINIYRLGGFMDDELKISYLIYNFGALTFSYYFSKGLSGKKGSVILSLIFLTLITTAIFLTAERSNFITILSFNFLVILYLAFNNKKIFLSFLITLTILITVVTFSENKLSHRMINDVVKKFELLKIDKNDYFLKKNSHYFAHYSVAYQIYEKNKFFGAGLKNFRNFCNNTEFDNRIHPKWKNRKCATHPHNFYFEMLSEIGLVGFILIIGFFTLSFYNFLKLCFKIKNNFLLFNSFIIIVYFIPLLPKGSFFTNWNAMIFWFIFSFLFFNYSNLLQKNNLKN